MRMPESSDLCSDGGCLKLVLESGEGNEFPQAGDIVQVRYSLSIVDGQVLASNRDSESPFEFELVSDLIAQSCAHPVCIIQTSRHRIYCCKYFTFQTMSLATQSR